MNDAYRPPVTDQPGPRPFVDQSARLRVLSGCVRVFVGCAFAMLALDALVVWSVIDLSSSALWAVVPAFAIDTGFRLAFLVVAIVLLRFLVGAHRNAIRIVGGPLPHSIASTVLWWLVPIANLWMPFRRVRELFAASSMPGAPASIPDSLRTWKHAWIVAFVLIPPSAFDIEPGAHASAIGRALVGCMCGVVAARLLLTICKELNALQLATWNAGGRVGAAS